MILVSDKKIDDEVLNKNVQEESEEAVENTESEEISEENTEECVQDEACEPESEKEDDKKGFFKKEKKKDKKDLMIEELTDKYKRTFAEFDNFRKRSEKEKAANFEVGAKSVVEKILPIIDNFERGFKSVSEEELKTPFAEGMDMIYKQLIKTLEDMGVKEIEAEGKEFDPNFHNAVMHIEDEAFEANIIAEVFQKGYMYKDTVIRHSMVKVAN